MATLTSSYSRPTDFPGRQNAQPSESGTIGDASATYRRLQARRGSGMTWLPAAVVVALAAAGAVAAYEYYAPSHAQQQSAPAQPAASAPAPAQTAANSAPAMPPAASAPTSEPATQLAPQPIHHASVGRRMERTARHEQSVREASNPPAASPPAAPLPYSALNGASNVDANAVTPASPGPMNPPEAVAPAPSAPVTPPNTVAPSAPAQAAPVSPPAASAPSSTPPVTITTPSTNGGGSAAR